MFQLGKPVLDIHMTAAESGHLSCCVSAGVTATGATDVHLTLQHLLHSTSWQPRGVG